MKPAILKWASAIVPSLLLATACATGPKPVVSSTLERLAAEARPPEGASLLYVLRPGIGFRECTMILYVDGIEAGMLPSGTYSLILSDPGERKLTVVGEQCGVEEHTVIRFEPNEIHFMYANLWPGNYFFFPEVPESRGRELMEQCILAPNESTRFLFPDHEQGYK